MESRKEYQKKYRQSAEYKAKNAERMKKRRQTDDGKAYKKKEIRTVKSRFNRAKRWNTKYRTNFYTGELDLKEWTISFEEYAATITRNCYYCNTSLTGETGSGLDRIDNSKGYTPGNVNPCCSSCNRIRGDSMSAEEFKHQSKLNGRWKDDPAPLGETNGKTENSKA
jgi:hypothetical protein